MTSRHLAACIAALMIFLPELSGEPASRTRLTFLQPDGSTFAVVSEGDEWLKVTMTADGCAIVKTKDLS